MIYLIKIILEVGKLQILKVIAVIKSKINGDPFNERDFIPRSYGT